jgi:hypothetical protein
MTNVRQSQQVNAYFRSEDTYASIGKESQAAGALSHIGLLDTFDPRMLDHQFAAVSTIGYSVAPHVLKGATNVMVPLKIGMWGDGWKTLLGRCIGQTTINSALRPAFLRPDVQTVAILAEEQLASTFQCSLASGVAFNKAELELDYTTNAPATINFDATAYYVVDRDANASRTTARDFTAGNNLFIQSDFSGQSIPSEPTGDPILPTDVTIQYATAATNGVTITNSSAANTYYEVGERFLLAYTPAGALDSNFGTSGVYDLTDSSSNTLSELNGLIDLDTNYTFGEGSASGLGTNLLKGVYKNGSTIKVVDSMTDWPFVKTVKLTIDNQHIPLPGVASGQGTAGSKLLQNNDVARGESIITLEITSTAKDETFYDQMAAETELPLVRLDFGTNGSIALTNGRILTRTAGYTAGTEVTETVTIQFYGAGDYTNYSKYAISGDF